MTDRTIKTVAGAAPQPGTGVLHPFPTPALPHIDPFVFLDTGAPHNLGTGDIYVGPHAHRGVQPVSLLFRGRIEHHDSLGNDRTVTSGGMQWLVSGSGALHEEVLNGDDDGVFHMAQLWINVPAALKMNPAEHHAVAAEHIPEVSSLGDGSVLRLYAGNLGSKTGPAPMPTPVSVAHVALESRGSITIPVPAGWTAAITVTSSTGAQFLLMCGEPIGEPIAMGGGFVMNTPEEITTAFNDYHAGRMGHLAPTR